MIQLFLHLLGDYFIQNDWMAVNKGKYSPIGWLSCLVHCILYSIPFGIYYNSFLVFFWVFISHFLIDKFGLAVYATMLINWRWNKSNFGMHEDRPVFLTLWLHIIRDNSIHLFCNYVIILHLL